MYFGAFPFLRYVLCLIVGILLAIYHPLYISGAVTVLVGSFAAYSILFFLRLKKLFIAKRYVFGLTGMLILLSLAYLNTYLATYSHHPNSILGKESEILAYTGVVTDPPVEKAKSYRLVLEVQAINRKDQWEQSKGKVAIYVSKEGYRELQYGQVLHVMGSPNLLDAPANPNEFDYKQFLSFQQIYHQQFLRQEQFEVLEIWQGSKIYAYMLGLREKMSAALVAYLKDERSIAVGKALLLGQKDQLDFETTQAYAAAGAMHVLAVSGLHVGILYSVLLLVFRGFGKSRATRISKFLLSLVFLWGFAMLTGLSPSVMRAATMFSFVALSELSASRKNIYNTLAASAFFLLIFNPYLIMSVGFQLSYLAVIGIVSLQPLIYQVYQPSNRLSKYIWEITAVSIAAQTATFPLGLLYFHQFPTYFIFSNLLVIPLAAVILYLGLGFFFFLTFLPTISGLLAYPLVWSIKLCFEVVHFVEKLPMATISEVYLSIGETWLIFAMIIGIFIWLEHQRLLGYAIFTVSCVLIVASLSHREYQERGVDKLTIYHILGASALSMQQGKKGLVLASREVMEDPSRYQFHIRPSHLKAGFVPEKKLWEQTCMPELYPYVITYKGKKLLILKGDEIPNFADGAYFDWVLIQHIDTRKLGDLEKIPTSTLIIDGSTPQYIQNRLAKAWKNDEIRLHLTSLSGAFEDLIK